jgi:hypothetical protein
MLKSRQKQPRFAGFATVAALAAVGAALGWSPIPASAAARPDAPRPAEVRAASAQDVDLEQLFWFCDHAAATRMIAIQERVLCDEVAAQLKAERFGGDLEQMLNWWRTNKVVQHRRLDGEEAPGTAK